MRTRDDLYTTAIMRGWKLNPNFRIVEQLRLQLNKNYDAHGKYYCPCKLQHIPENVCPCQDAGKEIKSTGHCHCQLFVKKD